MVSVATCYLIAAIIFALTGIYLIAVAPECYTMPLLLVTGALVFYCGYMSRICPDHLSPSDVRRQKELFVYSD